jgi:hypothetical protein
MEGCDPATIREENSGGGISLPASMLVGFLPAIRALLVAGKATAMQW